MSRRSLTGAQLGADIGLSATSVSRIIQGHSKPKQVTLSRLMKRLCVSSEDEQLILRAFTGVAIPSIEEPVSNDPLTESAERERVERWVEARTQAITFKDAVAREFDKAGISYHRDKCEGLASTDFYIDIATKRIAIECKFNVNRDFDKSLGIARLLRELMRCDLVIIIVPFMGAFAESAQDGLGPIRILTPFEAVSLLKELSHE